MDIINSKIDDLADIFTGRDVERFDSLSLPLQELMVEGFRFKWQMYSKRYQANSGVRGGAPKKWSDAELEKIIQRVATIKKTPEYLARKNQKNTEILAYEMLVEALYTAPDVIEILKAGGHLTANKLVFRQTIKRVARGMKERVRIYQTK